MTTIQLASEFRATSTAVLPTRLDDLGRSDESELADLLVADAGLILLDTAADGDAAVAVASDSQADSSPRS